MGAEAIKELLEAIDLEQEAADLKEELKDSSGQKSARIIKRLEVVEAFRESGNKPEWMIMDAIPVIPPDFGIFDILRNTSRYEFFHYKRFKQLDRHFLRQTALVNFQFRSYDDNGTTRIINTFSEQVLTETTGLTF